MRRRKVQTLEGKRMEELIMKARIREQNATNRVDSDRTIDEIFKLVKGDVHNHRCEIRFKRENGSKLLAKDGLPYSSFDTIEASPWIIDGYSHKLYDDGYWVRVDRCKSDVVDKYSSSIGSQKTFRDLNSEYEESEEFELSPVGSKRLYNLLVSLVSEVMGSKITLVRGSIAQNKQNRKRK